MVPTLVRGLVHLGLAQAAPVPEPRRHQLDSRGGCRLGTPVRLLLTGHSCGMGGLAFPCLLSSLSSLSPVVPGSSWCIFPQRLLCYDRHMAISWTRLQKAVNGEANPIGHPRPPSANLPACLLLMKPALSQSTQSHFDLLYLYRVVTSPCTVPSLLRCAVLEV